MTPRPLSKCQRCGDSYRDHRYHADGSGPFCHAVMHGDVFLPREPKASKRRSLSFNPAELDALEQVLAAVAAKDTRKALAVVSVRGEPLTRVLGRLRRDAP